MSLPGGQKSISERLDLLLIKILSTTEEYVQKKEDFLNVYRDVYFVLKYNNQGFFDLTTSNLKKNTSAVDHFDTEADITPLYKLQELLQS